MSVFVNWDNLAKTAIRLSFVAPWSWAEYEIMSHKIEALMYSVVHKVDLIIDVRSVGEMPKNSLAELANSYADTNPNLGRYILVGVPETFQNLMRAADRYYTALGGHLQFTFVDSLAEARLLNYSLG